jgi:hypothetical protein
VPPLVPAVFAQLPRCGGNGHRARTERRPLHDCALGSAIRPGSERAVYHLLSTKEPYSESVFHRCEEETLRRAELRLRRQAAQAGVSDCPSSERVMFLGSRLASRTGRLTARSAGRPTSEWSATSAETLIENAADAKHLGAEIGFLSVLHTWGQSLQHHPHVHCVIPAGGITSDHARWIPSSNRSFVTVRVLSEVFRGKFVHARSRAAGDHHLGWRRGPNCGARPRSVLSAALPRSGGATASPRRGSSFLSTARVHSGNQRSTGGSTRKAGNGPASPFGISPPTVRSSTRSGARISGSGRQRRTEVHGFFLPSVVNCGFNLRTLQCRPHLL